MEHLDITPSIQLYNHVRASFILQGSNLSTWCKAADVHPTNAKACLVWMSGGPISAELRNRIIKASGMTSLSLNDSVTHSSAKQPATTGAVDFFYWGC